MQTPRNKKQKGSFDFSGAGQDDFNFCQASMNGTGKAHSIRSSMTHKSKYTTASKLTSSQLSKLVSRANLDEKLSENIKTTQLQISVLTDLIQTHKINQEQTMLKFGDLFSKICCQCNELRPKLSE